MASILAVFALHTSGVLEEVAAQSAAHDVVELLYDKFVSVQLVDLFFTLSDSTLAVQPDIERPSVSVLLCYKELALLSKRHRKTY